MRRRSAPLTSLITESAALTIRETSARAHPHETGGILLGVMVEDRPWVTQALEFETDERGAAHYRLPGGVTHHAVESARAIDPRLGYLGDWHSHPMNVGASPTDRATMLRLAQIIRSWPGPLLVVARCLDTGDHYDLDTHQVTLLGLSRTTVIMTGDLAGAS